jgi:hypothetical protein
VSFTNIGGLVPCFPERLCAMRELLSPGGHETMNFGLGGPGTAGPRLFGTISGSASGVCQPVSSQTTTCEAVTAGRRLSEAAAAHSAHRCAYRKCSASGSSHSHDARHAENSARRNQSPCGERRRPTNAMAAQIATIPAMASQGHRLAVCGSTVSNSGAAPVSTFTGDSSRLVASSEPARRRGFRSVRQRTKPAHCAYTRDRACHAVPGLLSVNSHKSKGEEGMAQQAAFSRNAFRRLTRLADSCTHF